jgi:predicted enzyme related to lactoylglutathione lyase
MPTISHFDVAVDDVERAIKFYKELFGWKFTQPPGPIPYHLIETEDSDGKPGVGGGLGKRELPEQRISVYIGVDSVDRYSANVEKLGGKIVQPKMTVPGWGYLAICLDTENNTFGLWQDDTNAK